jgi:hypothetical protein
MNYAHVLKPRFRLDIKNVAKQTTVKPPATPLKIALTMSNQLIKPSLTMPFKGTARRQKSNSKP